MKKAIISLLKVWMLVSSVFIGLIQFGEIGEVIAPLTPHDPIRINNNTEFASLAGIEGWLGDGSPGDPFIIEGYDIDGWGYGYCIYIGNTTVNFEIRDSNMHEATGGLSPPYYYDSGITLYNVHNGTILNNTASSNDKYGIYLHSSSKNIVTNNTLSGSEDGLFLTYSDNNSITNNNATNNGGGFILQYSNNNTIEYNNVSSNNIFGIRFSYSNNNTIINNNISYTVYYGISGSGYNNTFTNNILLNNNYGIYMGYLTSSIVTNNTFFNNGIYVWGDMLEHWNSHIIDTTNTVNGKPVIYWKNQTGGIIPPGAGQVILANCTDVIVENQNVSYGTVGIELGFSNYNNITNTTSSWNRGNGFYIYKSDNNNITKNNISNNWYGIVLALSNSNNIFHNNINGHTKQASDDTNNGNQWDNGYPSGGNYWSDYTGDDIYSGPLQDILGGDGIGDTDYQIEDGFNKDNYPLMIPYGTPPPLTIDEIKITDNAGVEITSVTLDVLESLELFAWGFNDSVGPLGGIEVDWTLTAGGTIDVTTGLSTNFTAGSSGVSVTVTATFGGLIDDIIITINPPTIDYITIVDSAGTGVNEIMDQMIPVGFTITGYAAGFNTSSGYVGDISVSWSIVNSGGATATTNPAFGVSSVFDADVNGGTATWFADDGMGHIDQVNFNIDVEGIDFIIIMDSPNLAGSPVGDMTYSVYDTDLFYAAAFNNTFGYMYDVDAIWSSDDTSVGQIDSTGLPATFTAQLISVDDTCVITANYNGMTDDTGILTVLAPNADYIQIRNAPAGGGNIVGSRTFSVGDSDEFYTSAYNNTIGFIGEVSSTWTISPSSGVGTVTSPGTFTTFTALEVDVNSTCTITANYLGITNTTGTITVMKPSIDEIKITDTMGVEIPSTNLDVLQSMELFAWGFNDTSGTLGQFEVDWSSTPGGTIDVAEGLSTNFTAGTGGGTAIVTADYEGITDNLVFSINTPTIDYIQIRNETNNQGIKVIKDEFTLGEDDIKAYYCAGYNNTAGYISDVQADWGLDTVIGILNPSTGSITLFTATNEGNGNLTAMYIGKLDSITITVNGKSDNIAPAPPTSIVVVPGTETGSLIITWNPNTEPDLAGYNIYRSNLETGPFTKINSALIVDTSYTDSGLSDGTYYYQLTALDMVPNESDFSSIVSGTIAPPDDGDEDDDGLPDDWEIENFENLDQGPDDDFDEDGFSNSEEYILGSDPANPNITPIDIDYDGLPNYWEQLHFGNLDQESDDDYDNDGFTNIEEYLAGSDPIDVDETPIDIDGDGLLDIWELFYFGNLNQSANGDFDLDEFTNLQEYVAGADPSDDNDFPGKTESEKEEEDFISSVWWIFVIMVLVILVLIYDTILLKKHTAESKEILKDDEVNTSEDESDTDDFENFDEDVIETKEPNMES